MSNYNVFYQLFPNKEIFKNTKLLAVENIDVANKFLLGLMYANGYYCKENLELAEYWLTEAARQGDFRALVAICNFYLTKLKKHKKVMLWAHKLVSQGYEEGHFFLGILYLKGYGCKKNYDKAFEYLQKTISAPSAIGKYELGLCYEFGYGTDKDIIKAILCFVRAAAYGNEQADKKINKFNKLYPDKLENILLQEEFINIWNAGICDSDDEEIKFEYMSAGNNLAAYYDSGECGIHDLDKAEKIWLECAELGEPLSIYNIGLFYKRHIEIEDNLSKALYWLKKSAELGDDDASKLIAEIEQEISINDNNINNLSLNISYNS